MAKYVDMLRVFERHAVFVGDVRTLLAAGGRGASDDAAMTTRKRDARSHRRNWTTVAVTTCPPGWGIVYDIRGIRDADYEIPRARKRVGVEKSVTSCDLQILVYQATEAVSS